MKSLPDKNKVDEALQRICEHKLFKRSYTNDRLLRFLVEQVYSGQDVKEQIIGLELFKKDYSPEKNDSKIRVSVYYLRKKLKAYYDGDGKKEEIRFEIKKGQYNLSFINKEEIRHRIQHDDAHMISIPKKSLYITTSLIVGLIIGIYLLFIHEVKPNYCWSTFFKSGSSNVCVVSDHFVYRSYTEERGNEFTTSLDISTYESLLAYNKTYPDLERGPAHFTLFSKMAPYSIHHLTSWFSDYHNNFSIILESELRYEDYQNNNIIFIGQAKNMNVSGSVFLRDSEKFKMSEAKYISIENGVEIVHQALMPEGEVAKEYAFVSFVKLENGREALFFVSQHDIGVMATVKNFTNKAWLKNFYKSLPKGTHHFNALFEVSGVKRNGVICNMVEIETID